MHIRSLVYESKDLKVRSCYTEDKIQYQVLANNQKQKQFDVTIFLYLFFTYILTLLQVHLKKKKKRKYLPKWLSGGFNKRYIYRLIQTWHIVHLGVASITVPQTNTATKTPIFKASTSKSLLKK